MPHALEKIIIGKVSGYTSEYVFYDLKHGDQNSNKGRNLQKFSMFSVVETWLYSRKLAFTASEKVQKDRNSKTRSKAT